MDTSTAHKSSNTVNTPIIFITANIHVHFIIKYIANKAPSIAQQAKTNFTNIGAFSFKNVTAAQIAPIRAMPAKIYQNIIISPT